MKTIRTQKILTVLAAAALICTGCSDKTLPATNNTADTVQDSAQPQDPSTDSDINASSRSIAEIYQEIVQTVSLRSPQCMDDEFISNYYGIDAASLEEYVFSMSEDAAQAETVIIMKARNTDDLEGLADSLQTVVDEKKNEMENYIPEQFAIVEKSKVQTRDNYIWLVISDDSEAITDIIESGLF